MSEKPTEKKKVLIITYYWPPSGGSAVLRWLKFTKYLPEFGWEPTIYTPSNPLPQAYDYSLLKDVAENIRIIKSKNREPGNLFGFKKVPQGKVQNVGFISEGKKKSFSKAAIWIRGNFFIPDARMLWIRPSVKHLSHLLKKESFDAIVSTGPPHSTHMMGHYLKKKFNIPWLADFRDPWTNIDFYKELMLTRMADRKHHRLEKKVLMNADSVITVGPTMTNEFRAMGCKNVFTITNGFDELKQSENFDIKKFSILHVGSMPASRNPFTLWPVLKELCEEDDMFKNHLSIDLIGKVDHTIIQEIDKHKLNGNLNKRSQMPNNEAIEEMQKAGLLLLVINNTQNSKGILTNKFFEYLSVKRPILAIGPTDSDVANILNTTSAGVIIDYDDKNLLKKRIKSFYQSFLNKKLNIDSKGISIYSRKNLTSLLSKKLNEISDE